MDDDWADLVKPQDLTRQVALNEEDYYAERIRLIRKGYVTQSSVDQDCASLEALAQPGDEWWEWIWGTEKLMQMGGLALVRSGQIIWARNDWIS